MIAFILASALAVQAPVGLRPATTLKTITLDEAQKLATTQSFDLRIAAAKVDEASANVRKAWSYVLPQLSIGGGYTYSFPEATFTLGDDEQFQQQALLFNSIADLTEQSAAFNPDPVQQRAAFERAEQLRAAAKDLENQRATEVTIQPPHTFEGQVTFQMPLFSARALPLLQNAYSGEEMGRLGARQARAQISVGVTRVYLQAVAAKQIVEITGKQIESAKRHHEIAKQRSEAGLLIGLAVQRAELDVARAEQQQRAAMGGYKVAKAALGALIGVVDDFDVAAPSPSKDVVGDAETLVKRAVDVRDDIKLQRQALLIAERSRLDAWFHFLPSIGLAVQGRATSNTEGLVSNPFTGAISVQASVPLYDGGMTYGLLDETDAKLRQERLRLEQLEQNVEREVRGALDDVALKKDAAETALRVANLAQASRDNAEGLFADGAITSLELADANLAAFAASVDAARAQLELESARAGLALAIGDAL
jgi:outer membrane protein